MKLKKALADSWFNLLLVLLGTTLLLGGSGLCGCSLGGISFGCFCLGSGLNSKNLLQ